MDIGDGCQSTDPVVRAVVLAVLVDDLADVPPFGDPAQIGVDLNDIHRTSRNKRLDLIAVPPALAARHHYRRHRLVNSQVLLERSRIAL